MPKNTRYQHKVPYRCRPNAIRTIPVGEMDYPAAIDELNTALRAWQKAIGAEGDALESIAVVGTYENPVIQLRARTSGLLRHLKRHDPGWEKLSPLPDYSVQSLAEPETPETPTPTAPKGAGISEYWALRRKASIRGVFRKGMKLHDIKDALMEPTVVK